MEHLYLLQELILHLLGSLVLPQYSILLLVLRSLVVAVKEVTVVGNSSQRQVLLVMVLLLLTLLDLVLRQVVMVEQEQAESRTTQAVKDLTQLSSVKEPRHLLVVLLTSD